MKTRMYHIFFISLLALVCWGCNSQQNKERVSVIQTDLDRYNLKGKVKEVVTSYQRFYPIDSLSEKEIREYEIRNDVA